MNDWGKVLHDEDMAAAILDRVLERGRFIHLDGPSGRTRHLNPEETLPENTKRLRISGIGGSEFPEPTVAKQFNAFSAKALLAEKQKRAADRKRDRNAAAAKNIPHDRKMAMERLDEAEIREIEIDTDEPEYAEADY
jgi:hypothetical protein